MQMCDSNLQTLNIQNDGNANTDSAESDGADKVLISGL